MTKLEEKSQNTNRTLLRLEEKLIESRYEEALEHICKTCDNKSCPYIHYEKSRCVWYGIIKEAIEKAKKYDLLAMEEE